MAARVDRMRTPFAFLVVFLVACSAPTDDRGLGEARQRWEDHALTSYAFTWTQACYCELDWLRPIRVGVSAGQITEATFADDQAAVDDNRRSFLRTIDGVFDMVQRAVDDGDFFMVEFDATWGYPASLYIDPEARTADEEFNLDLADFAPAAR